MSGNTKKFIVKNGLHTQNIDFVSSDGNSTINAEMLDSSTLSFTGTSGQLFSITDSLTGTIFSVNDISGVPLFEVDADGDVRFAEFAGNVAVGTANATQKLHVDGNVRITGTIYDSTNSTGNVGQALTYDGNGIVWSNNTGFVGSRGFTGSKGDTGFDGSRGFTGSKGDVGFDGSRGFTGSKGDTGFTGSKGDIGFTGSQGADGNFGGATFDYTFDTSTTNSDPGAGKLRFNNASINIATAMYIDDEDDNSTDIQQFLRTIDDSTSTIKGHFRISNRLNADDFALFTISGLTENTGYFTVNCSYVSGSATSFSNLEDIIITFARTGDKGDTGFTGSKGDLGFTGSVGLTGSRGITGYTGSIGLTGSRGFTGSKGDTGFTGSQGDTSIAGAYIHTQSASSNTWTITHNLGYQYVNVEVIDSTGKSLVGRYDYPEIDFANTNSLTLTFSSAQTGYAAVTSGGGQTGFVGSKGDLGFTGSVGLTGSRGITGFVGSKGDLGFTGSVGLTGSRGITGFVGSQGDIGFTGSVGLTGSPGFTGSKGDTGFDGSRGFTGSKGDTGFDGSRGVTGFDGSRGFTGSKGDVGFDGSRGFTGSKGDVGFDGSRGVTGFTGSRGATGFTGSKGDIGYTGSKGDVGFDGSRGVTGFTGSRGATGFTGSQGADGNFGGATFDYTFDNQTGNADPGIGELRLNNASVDLATQMYIDDEDDNSTDIQQFLRTIDDSTSTIKGHFRISNRLNADDFALFTISGLTENTGYFTVNCSYVSGSATSFSNGEDIIVTFARTGDKGDTGFTGSKGATGFTGSVGLTGSRGFTGSKGDTGFDGSRGFTGSKGAAGQSGSTGFTGSKGDTGFDGSRGFTGSLGDTGFDGSRGFTGSKGDAGQSGSTGFTGSRGFTGSKGDAGQSGSTGFDGSRGFTGSKGDASIAGAYIHTQSASSNTWTITHNLGYQYVNVEVIDSTGKSLVGRYDYPEIDFANTNSLTLTFSSAQTGYAAVTSGGGQTGFVGSKGDPGTFIGGSNTQVIFNDAGSANGDADFTFNKTNNTLTVANANVTTNLSAGGLSYPTSDGSNGQALITNGSGTLTFGDVAADLTAVDSNIVPDADSTYDIGTTSLRWADLYVDDITVTGNVTANQFTETSSIRYKENIRILDVSDEINKLQPVIYDKKDGSSKDEVGLIAEEVLKVIPNVVSFNKDNEVEGIHYTRLIPYLISKIQQLESRIKDSENGKSSKSDS